MNVLIFGGTGLLGSAAAQIFIDRGHKVKTIALPPLPEGAPIPKEMDIEFGNFLELTDEELEKAMTGMLLSTQQVLMKELNSLILFMMHTKSIISTQPIVS